MTKQETTSLNPLNQVYVFNKNCTDEKIKSFVNVLIP